MARSAAPRLGRFDRLRFPIPPPATPTRRAAGAVARCPGCRALTWESADHPPPPAVVLLLLLLFPLVMLWDAWRRLVRRHVCPACGRGWRGAGRPAAGDGQAIPPAPCDKAVRRVSVPAAQATNRDAPLDFSAARGNGINIGDADAGGATVRVLLRARHGSVRLSRTAGLVFTLGDGVDNLIVDFTGTARAVNAALDGLRFTPTAGFAGRATLRVGTEAATTRGKGNAPGADRRPPAAAAIPIDVRADRSETADPDESADSSPLPLLRQRAG